MSKEIHVITVATHRTPAFLNFYSSLIRTNYNENNIHILGQGQKFQGWKWRTEQYLNKIKEINDPDALYVFCDSSDLFFIAGPTLLQKHYEEYKTPVIISVYTSYRTLFKNDYEKLTATCVHSPFCYPNGGFVVGSLQGLIDYFELNSEYIDDEQGAARIILENNSKFKLDTETKLTATLTQPPFVNYSEYWSIKNGNIKFKANGTSPVALHFPGAQYSYLYNEALSVFYPTLPKIPHSNITLIKIQFSSWFLILILICCLIYFIYRLSFK